MEHLPILIPCALNAWSFEAAIMLIDLYDRSHKSKVRPITGPEGGRGYSSTHS
jgi:hypothetical protein